MSNDKISRELKAYAKSLGFSSMGITPAAPSPQLDAYLRWIGAGMHGSMGYMAREDRVARRKDLKVILPQASSLIVVTFDYETLSIPFEAANDPARGHISNYAWGVDYHDVLLKKLTQLADFLQELRGKETALRTYVDTGAILERSHAEQAGLGFTGKNTMLIHPRRGSFFFIGEIITDVELPYDIPAKMPGCGSCTRCLAACPTDAFPKPFVLDARRCISYLTIEHKGFIERELRPLMGNWIYGCDVCQDVCPWQRFGKDHHLPDFEPVDIDHAMPNLTDLLVLDEERFAERYAKSPIKRIKRDRFVRNACIAAGNSRLKSLTDYLTPLLSDGSELVRGHSAWALGQLGTGNEELLTALANEAVEHVSVELQAALELV